MNTAELPFLSTAELGRLMAQKEVSPVEVTEASLGRIDDVDFQCHPYLTVCRTEALTAAREAEQAILCGEYRGPLHGIPVAVKDQCWTTGIRSMGGSRILADFVPAEDATVIAKLTQAGAVLLGKTNLTEFAITGFSHRFRTPRNPWNLETYTGGVARARPPAARYPWSLLGEGVGEQCSERACAPDGRRRCGAPRGPHQIEVWRWSCVDPDAPPEVKDFLRQYDISHVFT
jgi:hypothetical protein